MALTTVLDLGAVATAGYNQSMKANFTGHVAQLVSDLAGGAASPLRISVDPAGSATTGPTNGEPAGATDIDLTATFSSITGVVFVANDGTFWQLQIRTGLAAGHVGFHALDAAAATIDDTAISYTMIVAGVPV